MAKKLIVPDRSNRAETIDVIWQRLFIEESVARAFDFEIELKVARGYMAEGRVPQVALSIGRISQKTLDHAIIARRLGQKEESASAFRQAFAYFYWSEEIEFCDRQAEGCAADVRDDLLHSVIAWQSLSLVCGSEWFAQWVAPHLHNQFGQPAERPSLYGYALDKSARNFMTLVQRAIVTRQWPQEMDVGAMGGWGRLLAALEHPEAWEQALMDFCDWRVANALGYPEMGAPKRRRQSDGWSLLDREDWEQVFPIELLTLKYAYERATGKQVSLDAPHPLLQSHLMCDPFPALEPLWEDDLTAELAKFHAKKFGAQYGLRHPIEARYL